MTFGKRLREIAEQDGEPKPNHDLAFQKNVRVSGNKASKKNECCKERYDLDNKHHWIFEKGDRIELFESNWQGDCQQTTVKQRKLSLRFHCIFVPDVQPLKVFSDKHFEMLCEWSER